MDLECTLEDLYNGNVKRLVYTRTIINLDGRTTSQKEEERGIELFKGYSEKTILTFPGFGNEAPAQQNCIHFIIKKADLIVRIKEKKHKFFIRKGNNLVYTQKISLADALNGEPIRLDTLDERKLSVAIDEVIT